MPGLVDNDLVREDMTTNPNDLMKSIHNRVPVVLPRDAECEWLSARPTARKELCQPYPKDDLDAYEISPRVTTPATTILRSSSRWTTSNRASASSVPDS